MQIDWFTTIAQIINFLILVALLKRFLYQPVMKAMDEREARIATQLKDARETREEAEFLKESYESRIRELESLREKKINQVKKETETLKKEMLRKARMEVDQIQARWEEAIQNEKDLFLREIRLLAGEQVCEVCRKAIADLANADLEKLVVDVMISRIRDLSPDEKIAFQESMNKTKDGVLVQTAFPLPEELQKALERTIKDQFGGDMDITFEVSQDLVLGIAISALDRKISWTLEHYMEELEKNMREVLARDWENQSRKFHPDLITK